MARRRTNFPASSNHDGSHLKYAATVDFARKLRKLMAQKQWTQSDLAREVWGEEITTEGYLAARGRDKINKYIAGRSMPDAESLKRLAKALGVSEAELAPTVVGTTLEREHPEIRVTMIAGHRDHVHLTLDSVMPLEAAIKHMALFEEYRGTRGATAVERASEKPLTRREVVEAVQSALPADEAPVRHNVRGRQGERDDRDRPPLAALPRE